MMFFYSQILKIKQFLYFKNICSRIFTIYLLVEFFLSNFIILVQDISKWNHTIFLIILLTNLSILSVLLAMIKKVWENIKKTDNILI